jgi:hypothetical protein
MIHDWTRVDAEVFHDFRHAWIEEIKRALNSSGLPAEYYAVTEREPSKTDLDLYLTGQVSIGIRREIDDTHAAIIEIVSPLYKTEGRGFDAFGNRIKRFLEHSVAVVVIDLFPTPPGTPTVHDAIWGKIDREAFGLRPEKSLVLASYQSDDEWPPAIKAWVTPLAVDDPLPEMPLFVAPDRDIGLPLEATYQAAWSAVPRRWRAILEQAP